jgi:hypothetical protein
LSRNVMSQHSDAPPGPEHWSPSHSPATPHVPGPSPPTTDGGGTPSFGVLAKPPGGGIPSPPAETVSHAMALATDIHCCERRCGQPGTEAPGLACTGTHGLNQHDVALRDPLTGSVVRWSLATDPLGRGFNHLSKNGVQSPTGRSPDDHWRPTL